MNACNVLALPSEREGLPTVISEAGGCGLPVIASHVGGVPEILGNDRGYMMRDHTHGALQELIIEVMNNEKESRSRAARLRRHVECYYDARTNARQLRMLYELVVSRRKF